MKMMFIGATHEVTGSCTYIEACGKRFLVDFGMQQGEDIFENVQIPTAPGNIDFVLLTHAHIDHSGLLPLLAAGGFSGEIHATHATSNLCNVMLRDSAHIQEFEAEWRNRKGRRKGSDEFVPLYTTEDALAAISLFIAHKYDETIEICPGITATFIDAGHLLGSSSIILEITENGVTKKLVFSGDIGNNDQPLIRDPQFICEADYVVMESTYGDRLHNKPTDYVTALAEILQQTFDRGGNVIIPSFAVGRTQEMLYFLRKIKADNLICGHDDFPVYVDSPLANEATDIFISNRESCYDEEALSYVRQGINPLTFSNLIRTVTSDDSRAINSDMRPKVIISASGMCEAGRIKHHLKHNLWRSECTVLFVGYQANNTLGRSLIEGAKKVQLFGETIHVMADIRQLPGISGHADLSGLLNWAKAINGVKMFFVNHGDDDSEKAFRDRLEKETGVKVYAPYSGAEFDIGTGKITVDAKPVRIVKARNTANMREDMANLVRAEERLREMIKRSDGRTNRDLRKLAAAINEICDQWQL